MNTRERLSLAQLSLHLPSEPKDAERIHLLSLYHLKHCGQLGNPSWQHRMEVNPWEALASFPRRVLYKRRDKRQSLRSRNTKLSHMIRVEVAVLWGACSTGTGHHRTQYHQSTTFDHSHLQGVLMKVTMGDQGPLQSGLCEKKHGSSWPFKRLIPNMVFLRSPREWGVFLFVCFAFLISILLHELKQSEFKEDMKVKQHFKLHQDSKIACYMKSFKYSALNEASQRWNNTQWCTDESGGEPGQKTRHLDKMGNPRTELFWWFLAVSQAPPENRLRTMTSSLFLSIGHPSWSRSPGLARQLPCQSCPAVKVRHGWDKGPLQHLSLSPLVSLSGMAQTAGS